MIYVQKRAKRRLIFASFIICAVLILFLVRVEAASNPLSAVGDQIQGVQDKIDEIPKTPEGIADKYLKKEWDKIIIENKISGPMHKFFLNNQLFFRVFLNEDYAFTLTFLLTLIIWVFLMTLSADAIYNFGLLKRFSSLVFGLCFSVLVAKTGIIHKAVPSLIYFISSREAWWMRALVWLAFLAILIYLGYLIHGAGKWFSAQKKKRKEHFAL